MLPVLVLSLQMGCSSGGGSPAHAEQPVDVAQAAPQTAEATLFADLNQVARAADSTITDLHAFGDLLILSANGQYYLYDTLQDSFSPFDCEQLVAVADSYFVYRLGSRLWARSGVEPGTARELAAIGDVSEESIAAEAVGDRLFLVLDGRLYVTDGDSDSSRDLSSGLQAQNLDKLTRVGTEILLWVTSPTRETLYSFSGALAEAPTVTDIIPRELASWDAGSRSLNRILVEDGLAAIAIRDESEGMLELYRYVVNDTSLSLLTDTLAAASVELLSLKDDQVIYRGPTRENSSAEISLYRYDLITASAEFLSDIDYGYFYDDVDIDIFYLGDQPYAVLNGRSFPHSNYPSLLAEWYGLLTPQAQLKQQAAGQFTVLQSSTASVWMLLRTSGGKYGAQSTDQLIEYAAGGDILHSWISEFSFLSYAEFYWGDAINGEHYLVWKDGVSGRELFAVSDPASAPRLVHNFTEDSGSYGSDPGFLVRNDERLLFNISPERTSNNIYGDSKTYWLDSDAVLHEYPFFLLKDDDSPNNGRFYAFNGSNALFYSDLSEPGVPLALVLDDELRQIDSHQGIRILGQSAEHVFYSASDNWEIGELWQSDQFGTTEKLLDSLIPVAGEEFLALSYPFSPRYIDGMVYYALSDTSTQSTDLYALDIQSLGIARIATLYAGERPGNTKLLLAQVEGGIVFARPSESEPDKYELVYYQPANNSLEPLELYYSLGASAEDVIFASVQLHSDRDGLVVFETHSDSGNRLWILQADEEAFRLNSIDWLHIGAYSASTRVERRGQQLYIAHSSGINAYLQVTRLDVNTLNGERLSENYCGSALNWIGETLYFLECGTVPTAEMESLCPGSAPDRGVVKIEGERRIPLVIRVDDECRAVAGDMFSWAGALYLGLEDEINGTELYRADAL